MRFSTLLVLFCGVIFSGCGHNKPPPDDPLTSINVGAAKLGTDLNSDAARVTALAVKINAIGTKGMAATNANDKATATLSWQQILDLVDPVKAYAARLLTYVDDVKIIKTEVAAAKVERTQLRAELDKERSAGVARLRWIQFISVLGIGGFIVMGLLLHDMKWSVAGGIGCGAMIVVAQLVMALNTVMPVLVWTLYILAGLSVVWVLVEWKLRGSLKAALITDPISDIMELIGRPRVSVSVAVQPSVGPETVTTVSPTV